MLGFLSPNLPSSLYAECFAKVITESDKGRLEVRILLADQSVLDRTVHGLDDLALDRERDGDRRGEFSAIGENYCVTMRPST